MSLKPKSNKRSRSLYIYIGMAFVLAYAVFLLVSVQLDIAQQASEYEKIHAQLQKIQAENDQLERYSDDNSRDGYIESIARDELDYSYSDETIYYFIPGN